MGLLTIALVPIAMVLMQLSMKDYAIKRRKYDEANEQINNTVIEFVQGMQVVRTFDDGSSSFSRFRAALEAFTITLKEWSESTATSGRIGYLMFQSLPTLLVVAAGGSWMLAQNWITFPIFLLFLLLAPMVIGSFMPLMILRHHINYADMASRKIHEVLALPTMSEPSQPRVPQDASIRFERVDFAYDRQLVLSNVSFFLPAGSVTALVGPSGSGKSTIARLIPRFWDVGAGSIQIGQVDLRQMSQDTLMSMVSFVFQENFLLYDTVLENIRLGRPEASLIEVEAAAKAAQAHEFILDLPQGYETIVGERGARLSGGERQRITIARAILQDNPIIVLDEATAFTDPESEAAIQAAIAALTQNKTLLIVAHRLSTIVDADQIIVLDRGQVAEVGSHQALLDRSGIYAKLWQYHTAAQNWQLEVRRG
jgi:ATP-binding cassette, subfamily B, bacterial IrtA/YbtP